MSRPRILVIDNYDSFVYNLVQYLGELGAEPLVHRCDALTIDDVDALDPDGVLISPGPGRPADAGISNEIIRTFGGLGSSGRLSPKHVPVLGVCLGHQCIGEVFGGEVVRAPHVMHGKTSFIRHDDSGVFAGLPNPLEATRYHSLVVDRDSVPDVLEITAETDDGLVMGLRHREHDIEGVQFHPESILTVGGHDLLRTFLGRTGLTVWSAVEAVIFDYGGVLATSQWDAFADFERRHGLGPGGLVPYFAVVHEGAPAWHAIETGHLPWADFADQVVANANAAGVSLFDVHDLTALMPLGALWPMVHRVRRLKDEGYKLGILTNNVREFGDYWKATIPIEVFDVVVDSCDEGIRKPDPEIYLRASQRLSVAPEACVFLDDSAPNCDAAASVGMKTVVVGPDIDVAIKDLDALL